MNTAPKITLTIASAAVFFSCWVLLIPARQVPVYLPPALIPAQQKGPVFDAHWVSNNETNEAHSASIAITDGKPVAVWYGGTEEGHRDVAIFSSSFDGKWSSPQVIADRNSTEQSVGPVYPQSRQPHPLFMARRTARFVLCLSFRLAAGRPVPSTTWNHSIRACNGPAQSAWSLRLS